MTISRDKFELYEKARLSGKTNMYSIPKVAALTDLAREEIKAIMEDYTNLRAKYGTG